MKRRSALLKTLFWSLVVLSTLLLTPFSHARAQCPQWVDARIRHLSDRELSECSCWELDTLRNEIYARHGRIFNRSDLKNYFSNMSWYMPDPNNPSGERGQNEYERSNGVHILDFEKRVGCREGGGTVSRSQYCPSWPAQRTRYLDREELAACTCKQLELLRNEIYARHGGVFNREDLQRYFSDQPWYMPDANNRSGEKGQNKYERSNATKILQFEKTAGCR